MRPFRVNELDDAAVVNEPREDATPETVSPHRENPLQEGEQPELEHAKLLAHVRRLEVELARYREHAQRTSKLFLSATKYADWVRENARRDAELALRKARARAEKLYALEHERERTEHEVARLREELARLQALTDETRARLSAFLTAGLEALSADTEVTHGDDPEPEIGDLQETLKEQLTSTPVQTAQPER